MTCTLDVYYITTAIRTQVQWPLPIGKVVRLIVTMAALGAAVGGEEVTMF